VIRAFAQSGNKGVDIAGDLGSPVLAAAAGRVVYSGSGLVGYGKLIILKHNNSYLSAYAHNDRLLVEEGASVAGGQRIAQMGRTGTQEVKLHFEIRRDGKPVDPSKYLPLARPAQEEADA
jgi:lipoprotein NlpD